MTHKFIVNTESVNSYGYRILTGGIDYSQYMKNPIVLFMHDRYNEKNRGSEVIGTCKNLKVENNQLIAEIEFDSADEFAKKIEGKVERDILKMASMFAEKTETSTAPEDVLPGQTYETVKRCKLIEISIVDVGGNDDALKLSKSNGEIQLKKINQKPLNNMNEFEFIALAMGKSADSDKATILAAVNDLKLEKQTAENEANNWKSKFLALQKSEAESILDKAVKLNLIPEALKPAQLMAFESDFEGTKLSLNTLISEKETENEANGVQSAIGAIVNLSKGASNSSVVNENSFDYLQKHNSVELSRLRSEEPQKYVQLAKDYASGVRYTAK